MRPVQFETTLPHHLVELMTHTGWSPCCSSLGVSELQTISSVINETVLTGRFKMRKSRLHLNLDYFPASTLLKLATQYKRWM